MDFKIVIENTVLAAFACVGLIETVKSFFKTEKKWIYAIIMIPLSIGCYAVVLYLPPWVIGGVLTVAFAQLGYQTIVQSVQTFIKSAGKKIDVVENKMEDEE